MFLADSDVKLAIHGGFPTIFKLLDGKIEYYEGNRDAKSMISGRKLVEEGEYAILDLGEYEYRYYER